MSDSLNVMVSDSITVKFGWDAYPKKYSGGLISGLIASNTIIDCDARAFFLRYRWKAYFGIFK